MKLQSIPSILQYYDILKCLFTFVCSLNNSPSDSDCTNKSRKHKRKRQKQEQSQYWTSNETSISSNEKKIGIVEPRVVIKQPQALEAKTKDLINPSPGPVVSSKLTSQNNIGPGTCRDFKNKRETAESCSESTSESSEDEMEPIKVAKKRRKVSKKNRLRRKAEALLRLAAQADKRDERYSTNTNPGTVTNFRLVLALHFIRYLARQ